MESEKKSLLFEKLAGSLKERAKAIGQASGMPNPSDIHEMKEMTDLYLYLLDEHTLTDQEIDALLQFEDPMLVASACWEANSDFNGFDICDIMEAINCREDYPMVNAPA